jgi:hypothetical protein
MKNKFPLIATVAVVSLFGALAAHADPLYFSATLSGAAESPPNASSGTGSAWVIYDMDVHSLSVHVDFTGLTGTTTASHIHAATPTAGSGTAGVATQTPTFTNFPLGVTSGSYEHVFDLTLNSSWNSAFIAAHDGTAAGAEEFFADALLAGKTYLNVHTNTSPSGEIRGFLNRVPDSSATSGLLLLGLSVLGWIARRQNVIRSV